MKYPPSTIAELIISAEYTLANAGVESATVDARILVEHVSGMSTLERLLHPQAIVSSVNQKKIEAIVARRKMFEPIAYIVGEKEFYGHAFFVDRSTLIPRPDTETLIEQVLARIPHSKKVRILDLCTGSGCIGITLALELPMASVVLSDIDVETLECAQRNLDRHKLSERIITVHSDLFKNLGGEKFDVITANPPYIPSHEYEALAPDVRDFEPSRALLCAQKSGTHFHEQILVQSLKHLRDGGFVVFEIGFNQADKVGSLSRLGFRNPIVIKDLAQNDRVVIFEKCVK